MRLHPQTFRGRLTLAYSLILAILLTGFGVSLYAIVRLQLLRHHDEELIETAEAVEGVLSENEDCEHLTPAQVDELNQHPKLVLFHSIGGSERVFYSSPNLSALRSVHELTERPDFLKEHAAFKTYPYGDGYLRVLTRSYRSRIGRQGSIRVMQSIGDVSATLAKLRLSLLVLVPLAILASSFVSYRLARRALKTVDEVTTLAREIEASQLSRRLPTPPVPDEIGRLVETFNQMIDRLERSFEGMKRFTADASHELRSPLANMRGTIDVALGQPRTAEEYRNALASVGEEGERLRHIVEDLLVLARADSRRIPLEKTDVRLDTVVSEVVESCQERAGALGVALAAVPSDRVSVQGDERWLRQLVFNLVENAVKFTAAAPQPDHPPEVRVAASEADRDALLTVVDSGPGIPEADLGRVFERFYRADWARVPGPSSGFGLGLSIASWIVQAHGGTLRALRRPEGGTEMLVRLPLAAPTPQT